MKRFMSLILAICLVICVSSVTVFAKTPSIQITAKAAENYSLAELAIIENEREKMHADIRAQLLAQDALDQYDLFVSILDAEFNEFYFPTSSREAVPNTIWAPSGAWLRAHNSSIEIMETYLSAQGIAPPLM